MLIKRLIFLLFFFNISFSCSNSRDSKYEIIVNEWIGKKIRLPGSSMKNNLKIVTSINGNCYPCIIRLKEWNSFIKDFNNYNVGFIFYIVAADSTFYKKINENEIHLDYPVIFDPNNTFQRYNNLPKNNRYHTMLLSKNNTVIIIGDPLGNLELKVLYLKKIEELYIKNE